jgi:osmoprotectant transport system substrate-binding protein
MGRLRRHPGGRGLCRRAGVVGLVSVLALAACGGDGTEGASPQVLEDDRITVASFDFAESELLAEIYSQAMEAAGFDVERVPRLGRREFVGPALARGLVEFVPEYAGTALEFVSLGNSEPTADVEATHEELSELLGHRSLVALAAAPAQTANAFVVSRQTAAAHGLEKISDLAAVSPELTLGGPPECPRRPFCAAGLERVYDLEFDDDRFVPLDAGGPVTRQALDRGFIDVALLFTTDPKIDNYVELDDDRHLQPAENVVPVVHRAVVDRWGARLVDVVDEVSSHLTTEVLRALNGEVVDEVSSRLTTDALRAPNGEVEAATEATAVVASAWLRGEGLG